MLEVLIGKASAQLAAGQDGKACSIIKHVTRECQLDSICLDNLGESNRGALMEIAFQLLAVPVALESSARKAQVWVEVEKSLNIQLQEAFVKIREQAKAYLEVKG
ncbi:hypothetical protein Tco_0097145 [Tanacetum coccineum]